MSSTYNPSQTQYPQASPGKVLGAGTSRQNYFNQSISNFAVSMDENLDRIGEENL
jgi:hypothetical protein